MATAAAPAPPARRRRRWTGGPVGGWVLGEWLGRGSFADVWAAHAAADPARRAAVKEVHDVGRLPARVRAALAREAETQRRVRHANVAALLEPPIEAGAELFFVVELCAGGDLAAALAARAAAGAGPLPEAAARALVRQLAAGLAAVRAQNLLHRDLKPQNLLLAEPVDPLLDGEEEEVEAAGAGGDPSSAAPRRIGLAAATLKIADFGFARELSGSAGLAATQCGSPLYMAPELLAGREYDSRADLWSVGCILHELLAGAPPFSGRGPAELARAVAAAGGGAPPLPRGRAASAGARHLLGRLLRRDPAERCGDAEFFAHPWLAGGEREPAPAAVPPPPPRAPPREVGFAGAAAAPAPAAHAAVPAGQLTHQLRPRAASAAGVAAAAEPPPAPAPACSAIDGVEYVLVEAPPPPPGASAPAPARAPRACDLAFALEREDGEAGVGGAAGGAWPAASTLAGDGARARLLQRVALALAGLASERQQDAARARRADDGGGAGNAALRESLALHLAALQLFEAALEGGGANAGAAEDGDARARLAAVARGAEGAAAALRAAVAAGAADGGAPLPDPWPPARAAAARWARDAAAGELLGRHAAAAAGYRKAGAVFAFLAGEGGGGGGGARALRAAAAGAAERWAACAAAADAAARCGAAEL